MPISSGVRAIMGAFGPLLAYALEKGRGAAGMWQTFQETYERLGQPAPSATIQDMNFFVGGLGGIQQSVQALGRALDTDALTSEHIVPPIGYEASGRDFAVPSILATYELQIDTEEGLVSRWSSLAYNTLFPATVGELRSDAMTVMQQHLDESSLDDNGDYPEAGGTVVGVGQMYITGKGL